MSGLRVAPAAWFGGGDALEALARHLADGLGARAVLLVHGPVGYPVVRGRLDAALAAAGVRAVPARHDGPCTARAIETLADGAVREDVGVVLGVGGGRVLDAAKGAALTAGLPFAALPTSPATCAATAATVVVYDERGAHQDVLEGGPVAAACALDPGVLASAPDRLLAAGIVDAWAKVHEVRLTSARAGGPTRATTRAALALVDDLGELLRANAQEALAAGPGGARDPARLPQRRLVAEAVVAYPGLIGGLAGADAKLALAHPLHDALTHLPGAHVALHGEKVAFGSLVQLRVAGAAAGTDAGADGGADDPNRGRAADRIAVFREEAARYAALGVRCDLEALGCGDARSAPAEAEVVRRTLADPSVTSALPSLGFAELLAAVREVDAWLRQARGAA